MASKRVITVSTLMLALVLACPGTLFAGPYFGDWGWFWHPAPSCQRGEYSPLHYWTPEAYQLRAHFHRVNIDQYPPGPSPSVPPSFEYECSKCRTLPSAPSSPYASPEAYYGRPIAPMQK